MLPIGDDNSQRRLIPFVTWGIILINVVVFIYELSAGNNFITQWSFIPLRFTQNPGAYFITLFTYMFLHASWLHLGGNMLYLLIFGDNIEDRFGHAKFLVFYLLCGLIAMLSQYIPAPTSDIPNLGASGAIAGVLGAYIVLFPAQKVRVLIVLWVVRLPALLVIGFWIILQVFNEYGAQAAARGGSSGVAYMAHIGGFLAGILLSFFFRGKTRTLPFSYPG